jgi:hypothetical protein
MLITLSPLGLLGAFKELGANAKLTFVELLLRGGHLHAVIERAVIDVRQQRDTLSERVKSLDNQVARLKAEVVTIKRQSKIRLTRVERKTLIAEWSKDGLDAKEIAAQLTDNGEPISHDAVRQVLSRLKNAPQE